MAATGPRGAGILTAPWATVALAVLLSLSFVGHATAIETETFSVAPSPLQIQGHERRTYSFALEPGDAASDAVRITNKSDETREFRLYAADARQDPESASVTIDAGTEDPVGVGRWVELARDEIRLAPHSSGVVEFTIRRPAGATAEGLGAIVVEEVGEANADAGIDLVYRLGILIRLGGDVAGLRVSEPTMHAPVQLFPSRSRTSVTLTNETLGPITATVGFTAAGLTGRYWELETQDVRLTAGEVREVTASWETVPRWGGLFRPATDVTWHGGSIVRAGPRALHPPLWLLALVILLVAVRGVRELRSRERPADT